MRDRRTRPKRIPQHQERLGRVAITGAKNPAGTQPGLGTVMIEYSNRYTDMYYAAKSGNWPLAAYQLKEALEIQEVGETTHPARAERI